MVKNRHQDALRQRNIRRGKKRQHDKYKAFYNYVFSQDPELILPFEARQEKDGQDEEMAYINDLSLLY